jgi:hypothetical protein
VGCNDKINPPDHALRIADCFRSIASDEQNVNILQHNGGHYLPQDEAHLLIFEKLFHKVYETKYRL